MMTKVDARINELLDLAASEGINLPYPPEVIVGLEDKGKYVDLTTRMIGDADERVRLTVIGEASSNYLLGVLDRIELLSGAQVYSIAYQINIIECLKIECK